jgi:hypothetical protein
MVPTLIPYNFLSLGDFHIEVCVVGIVEPCIVNRVVLRRLHVLDVAAEDAPAENQIVMPIPRKNSLAFFSSKRNRQYIPPKHIPPKHNYNGLHQKEVKKPENDRPAGNTLPYLSHIARSPTLQ